jgi:hypothetical protein
LEEHESPEKPVIPLDKLLEGGKRNDRTNPITGITPSKPAWPIYLAMGVVALLIILYVARKIMNSG